MEDQLKAQAEAEKAQLNKDWQGKTQRGCGESSQRGVRQGSTRDGKGAVDPRELDRDLRGEA
jgi:hypothetical protein